MAIMKYLIAGKNGQLAQAFIRRFEEQSVDYSAPEESVLNITDEKAAVEAVDACSPDIILNCAAYNLVDKAEQEKEKALLINAIGPEILARAAAKRNAIMVHFGSDYVFDGMKENNLYSETDPANPLNEYGKSKLAGEDRVMRECKQSLVFRLSWVFGDGQQNFIYKLRSWAQSSEYLKIACDEFSVPTSAHTVVDITLKALHQGLTGRYHLTNSGFCSRYDWAKLIWKQIGVSKFIRPVSMDSFNLPAKRPKFSAMSNEKISGLLNVSIPSWEEAVISFLRENAQA